MKNHGIARHLWSVRAYAFRCPLTAVVKEPCRFSILTYPKSLDTINLRKFDRMSCIIDAEVGIRGRGYGGIITDVPAAVRRGRKNSNALNPRP